MKPTVGGVKHASIDFLFGDLDSEGAVAKVETASSELYR
jgi:hypothetical protein